MTYKDNCPICNEEVENTRYSSEWGTEEEYYHCKKCGYSYEFAYGNYKEFINEKEFCYSYHDNKKDLVDMYKEYDEMKKKYEGDVRA